MQLACTPITCGPVPDQALPNIHPHQNPPNFPAGGWYIEWVGHEQRCHPAWLDPAVAVLAAGFDSLEHERTRQQPQGLFGRFGRLRAGDETAGGPLAWVRAMLRFHGVRK